jgi:hypothetical protein
MDRAALKRRVSVGMDALVKKHLNLIFKNNAAPQIQEAILAEYDEELVDVVTDRRSRTNPNFYRSDFNEQLEEFEYIEDSGNTISLNVPDMENFEFVGRLKVIETIMQGTIGTYVEVDERQYLSIFNEKPKPHEVFDSSVAPRDRIYLVRYTKKVSNADKEQQLKLVEFPFSNTPPINIFEAGNVFAKENMDRWIREALEAAQKEFVNTYKGVR